MKLLNQEEAKSICDKVMSFSKADECNVQLGGERTGNIRFARNAVSTSGVVNDTQLVVSVAFGKKQGTATINEFDDKYYRFLHHFYQVASSLLNALHKQNVGH